MYNINVVSPPFTQVTNTIFSTGIRYGIVMARNLSQAVAKSLMA